MPSFFHSIPAPRSRRNGLLAAALVLGGYITFQAQPTDHRQENPAPGARQAVTGSLETVRNRFLNLPLHFEPNAGQAPPSIRFLARGAGFGLFLEDSGMRLVLSRQPDAGTGEAGDSVADRMVIQFQWPRPLGGPPRAEEALPGRIHYLLGRNPEQWHTGIQPYRRVRYESVYPGIDLVVYGNQRRPEYDFVLSPGADPARIRLTVGGIETLSVDAKGRLILETGTGTLVQSAPVAYQSIAGTRKPVAVRYRLVGSHQVGFDLTGYDPAYPLVIDPILLTVAYATYLGGNGADLGLDLALDGSGNVYVAGRTASTDFPTQGPFQGSLGGGSGSDAFVTKLNSAGTALVYSTYLGGAGFDEALGLALDSSNQAYITGRTTSTDFPTQGAIQGSLGGGSGQDAFVSKLSADGGSLVYSTYLGGSGTELGQSIAVDGSGNAYLTGQTDSTDFPTANARQSALAGGSGTDAFITKINAAGNALVYSTYHGGSGSEEGKGIATDSSGNAYVAGQTTSTDFPTQSAFQTAIGDGTGSASDAFVSKLNSTGSALTFSSYLGGTGEEVANDLAVDSSGKVYVVGRTASTDFPVQDPFQSTLGGGSDTDAFVARVLADGSGLDYASYLGGSAFDEGLSVAVDLQQNTYVAGRTDSPDFPLQSAVQSSLGGGSGTDAFAARVNSFGTGLSWATYLGGSGTEQATGIAADSSQNVYLAGFTASSDFPTRNPFQASLGGGGQDAFVAKILSTETNPALQPETTVILPYWQTEPNIYTFIAISHPSLEGMNSQIGVRAMAFDFSGSQYAVASEFTVNAGETRKLFIVQANDPVINATNLPNASFIQGSPNAGWTRFAPVASEPTQKLPGPGGGFPDITMLSYWGAVIIQGSNTGFAVSFIGDAADSASHPNMSAGRMPSGLR